MSWLNDAEVTLPKTSAELLADAQEAKIMEINTKYSDTATPLIKDYPEVEQTTWTSQNYEALSYLKAVEDGTPIPDLPVLTAILSGRNGEDGTETMAELVRAVLDNATKFTQFQTLTGKRQRLVKRVRAATSVDEVATIQWEG